jgi:hypothetical protein
MYVYVCKSVEQCLYKGVFMCVYMRGACACLFNLTIVRRKLEDAEERLEASLLGYLIEIRHECLKVLPVEEHEPPVEVVPVHLPPLALAAVAKLEDQPAGDRFAVRLG